MTRITAQDPLLLDKIQDELFLESSYIDKLHSYITENVESPLAISIDGGWGTGKTTIMKLLEDKLKSDYPTFWFNPWEYKGSGDVVLCFLKNLANAFPEEVGYKGKNIGRFFQLLAVAGIDLTARIISHGQLSTHTIAEFGSLLKAEVPKWENHPDIVAEIREEFVTLTNKISKKKTLYIFLDDFDRCLPDDTIKLLEAIKNLFIAKSSNGDKPNVIFVCGINSDVARSFITKHYHLDEKNSEYALNYFKKMFSLIINVPQAPTLEPLLKRYFIDAGIDDDTLYSKLVEIGAKVKMESIRKYQNILHNLHAAIHLHNLQTSEHKMAALVLLMLKETDYDFYQILRQHVTHIRPDASWREYNSDIFKLLKRYTTDEDRKQMIYHIIGGLGGTNVVLSNFFKKYLL